MRVERLSPPRLFEGGGGGLLEFLFPPPPGREGTPRPRALLSLRAAGSMRYLAEEANPRRGDFFASLGLGAGPLVGTELHHTRRLRLVELSAVTGLEAAGEVDLGTLPGLDVGDGGPDGAEGRDGLLFIPSSEAGPETGLPRPIATVTVADCMPLWLWDAATGAWGLLHSGWKGTGILEHAIRGLVGRGGGRASTISVILGPAIGSCCYEVPEERAAYFAREFGEESVDLSGPRPRLDIRAANLSIASRLGVGALLSVEACTSCEPRFGSFRREGSANFTRMVAACVPV